MKKHLLTSAIILTALICIACSKKESSDLPQAERPVFTESICPAPYVTPLEIARPTETPLLISNDDSFLILVNFKHQIYEEPPVVPVCDYLTTGNVYCDPRRHANETAVKALNEMLLAAQEEGDFHFIIASAFRYIWEQQMMWEGKIKEDPTYGSDPYNNPVKLMPTNCSEHTTGLAFDILCDACPHSNPGYENTPEAKWLVQNAHRFGFILRYPEGKQHITGVQFEPWHFRYVGVEAAEYIYAHSLCLEEFLNDTP